MKKQLLYCLLLLFPIALLAQATAYQPSNMTTYCNSFLFNLTQQTAAILGNQTGNFQVRYFQSESDASANQNYITNPSSYTATPMQLIFARVTNLSDASFAITSFTLVCNTPYQVISQPGGTMHVCVGSSITLSIVLAQQPNLQYQWIHNAGNGSYIIPGETASTLTITPTSSWDGGFYQCQVSNGACGGIPFVVQIIVDTPLTVIEQPVDAIVCNGQSTQFHVGVTGTAISYQWQHNGVPIQGAVSSYRFINSADLDDAGDYVCVVNGCNTVTTDSAHLNVNIGCDANTISGDMKYDFDANGCSNLDMAATGIQVFATNGTVAKYAYTNDSGHYALTNLNSGQNAVTVGNPPSNFNVVTPTSLSYNIVTGDILTGADFCLTSANPGANATVYFYPMTAARPGFPVYYGMRVVNNGTVALDGNLLLTYDSSKIIFSSANPNFTTQNGNQLGFTITDLLPFEDRLFLIYFMVKIPPDVDLGDVISFGVNFESEQTDIYPTDNLALFNHLVVNSYDPNEMIVQQGAYINQDQTNEYLNYIVHFQNMGNADAINVALTNTLDANLDWESFRPVVGSHPYTVERVGNQISYTFAQIHLAASSVNEADSKGYVVYKVKPKAGIVVGDVISNTAKIYFDFNAPIVTNTVTTTLINSLSIPENTLDGIVVYPNPSTDELNIKVTASLTNDSIKLCLYDIQGKEILNKTSSVESSIVKLNVAPLQRGFYFLKISSKDNTVVKKVLLQ